MRAEAWDDFYLMILSLLLDHAVAFIYVDKGDLLLILPPSKLLGLDD